MSGTLICMCGRLEWVVGRAEGAGGRAARGRWTTTPWSKQS